MHYKKGHLKVFASDLSNHLACGHLTHLDKQVADKIIDPPCWKDPSIDVLEQRGRDHEAAYVEFLTKKGFKVIDLNNQRQEATLEAMGKGYDIITQATLGEGKWEGRADILMKVDLPSKLGDWSYEVQDTKLSQNTKVGTIIQLCVYSDLLKGLQGISPVRMHVVMPGEGFPSEHYFFNDFKAYYNLIKKQFETAIDDPKLTYPDPVQHCKICKWWQVCDKRRHEDDHLSLVAGIRSMHISELQEQDVNTLEQFARLVEIKKPKRGSRETFKKKHDQAKIQLRGREEKRLISDMLPVNPDTGLNRLPEPNGGDIYFDIEGDAFFEDGGLEYLLGFAYNENGKITYQKLWSSNRVEEKKAFMKFIEFVTHRWKKYPGMYIYHFAPYETIAIERLARVHAVYETEVANLLRGERFIDLHAVFKESLLASVESYSLKELEKFTKYTRQVLLHDASVARKSVEVALELHNYEILPKDTIETVEGYNMDDCLATEALHKWLEGVRTEQLNEGEKFQRPEIKEGEGSENVKEQDTRSQALYNALIKDLPDDKLLWSDEHKAKWLLAHQIDYFRREDRSYWSEYFRIHKMDYEDLLDERKAIAGLEFLEELPREKGKKTPVHRYRYVPQETSIDVGNKIVEVNGDEVGSIHSISYLENTIDIKKTGKTIDIHPTSIHTKKRVDPGPLAKSIMDLAFAIDEYGLDHKWPYHASKDLLMKRKPQLVDGVEGAELLKNEDIVDGAIRLAKKLDKSVLAIQGPPGSGKTHTGAKMIIELVKAGNKVGITAVSHAVVRNLCMDILKLASEMDHKIEFVHKIKEKDKNVHQAISEVSLTDKVIAGLNEGKVGCGTAWLWAEDKSNDILDYLFVDEAGQMSLSHVLAASRATKNLILLGDPQQLEQPQKGSHPEGSDVAALTYLLDGKQTMPKGRGLFLGVTYRLHPDISKFTSEIFYENRLDSQSDCENQLISGGTPIDGAGLFYVPVAHTGNQSRSIEEVSVIVDLVNQILALGKWTDNEGITKRLAAEDILIVAPYNAQVVAISEKLPEMRVGTVDKFQGQQAPIVIYSMTSSSQDDAPRGMNFLYSPNRLNVATSRAKCACLLIANPKILEPECRTIDQMRWANALCRYLELTEGN